MAVPPSKKLETPLARAAAALEAELGEYEKFVVEVKRMSLNSEKAMHRAKARIQQRIQNRSALLERFSALGDRARALNEPVAALEAKQGEANAQDLLTTLGEVATRTEAVIAEADTLGADAQTDDWQDIAREATTLKQQIQSARNKILVAQRDVASRTPS
jgi:hypothetical protein